MASFQVARECSRLLGSKGHQPLNPMNYNSNHSATGTHCYSNGMTIIRATNALWSDVGLFHERKIKVHTMSPIKNLLLGKTYAISGNIHCCLN